MSSWRVKKRLAGKQDINWDTSGTGEKANFTGSDGLEKELDKVNASHVPLLSATRPLLNGATEVDGALSYLGGELHRMNENFSVLAEDTLVIFDTEATISEIQTEIDSQIKNLGGHTLTFQFPASLSQSLTQTLVFQGFSNGHLIISGGNDPAEKVELLDRVDLVKLVVVTDCTAHVTVENLIFNHQYSRYGLMARRCIAVDVRNCDFIGNASNSSVAVLYSYADGNVTGCTYIDDKEILTSSNQNALIESRVSAAEKSFNSSIKTLQNQLSGKAASNHTHTNYIGFPKYSAAVQISGATLIAGYTAPSDGWILFASSDRGDAYVNNVRIGYVDYASTVFVPIKKGQVATCNAPLTDYGKFFPAE